jgi:hypothetical protein
MWLFDDSKQIRILVDNQSIPIFVNGYKYQIKDLSVFDIIQLNFIYNHIRKLRKISFLFLRKKKKDLRRAIKIRFAFWSAFRKLNRIVGHKVKKNDINILIGKILNIHKSQFDRISTMESAYYDRNWESWPYIIIDELAHEYGWTIDYILSLKWRIINELRPVANNRNVSKFIDNISIALAGYAGSTSIIDVAKNRVMKRNMFVPIAVRIAQDQIESEKIFNILHRN